MRKRFYGALVLGSFLLAGGMVTSCSDYDDDIDGLNQRMDAVEATVAELQKKIEAGSVITGVNTVEDGVEITLSNGEKFNLKNGANGAASVVEIGDNGNWYIDGKDTGKPSRGEQGPAGDTSAVKYYEPRQDGFWYEITINADGTTKEEKKDSWMPEGTMTAVYNSENGQLLISNVEGMPAESVLVIETWGELKSLAVIPYVIDNETKLPVVSFYNIIKDGKQLASTNAQAHFRLNPSNANIEGWEWSIIDREVITRAEGDNINNLLNIKKTERGEGELIVTLESKKSLKDLSKEKDAIFALNASNKENGNNIASDYAKVTSADLTEFALIDERNPLIEEATANPYPTEIPDINSATNADLDYRDKIDLDTLVQTWGKHTNLSVILDKADLDGLTYEYSKPEKYLGKDKVTNQQEFVNLDGSVVSINDYNTAAVGRTPIFKVVAKVNGTEVASGYIKLNIIQKDVAQDYVFNVDCGTINYQDLDAFNKQTAVKNGTLAWEEINKFYSQYGLTQETFFKEYNVTDEKTETGVDIINNWVELSTSTHPVMLDMDPTAVKVLGQEDKVREATLTFSPNNTKAYPKVIVKFTYKIEDKVTFPALNPDYKVGEDMVEVKGKLVNGKWEMISGIDEHFQDYLANYKLANNHPKMYAELLPRRIEGDDDPFLVQDGAEITPIATIGDATTAKDQNISLTSPLTTLHRDYVVDFHITLANGEQHTMLYKVRFTTPFTVSVAPLSLKTLVQATTADLAKAVTITGIDGATDVIYKNGKVQSGSDTKYGIKDGYFTFEYGLTGSSTDSWESFGNHLTIDKNTGIITWNNAGAVLQNNKYATPQVKVTAGDIAVITTDDKALDKKVEIKSSANSQQD